MRLDLRSGSLPLAAILLVLAGGVVNGRWNGRWEPLGSLDAANARLERLPLSIGTWQGQDEPIDQAMMQRAGVAASAQRRYRDSATGISVVVMLLCGRPGPIAVHTPEICYAGAGFDLVSPATESVRAPGFRVAEFVRPSAAVPETLHIYWAWNASDRWESPASPRLAFAGRSHLYKLYVVRSAAPGERLDDGPAAAFTHVLAEVLDLSDRSGDGSPPTGPPRDPGAAPKPDFPRGAR